MTEAPLPDDAVTGSAAVRVDAIPGDAVAAGDDAVPVQAVASAKGSTPSLCLVDNVVANPELYCRQLFNVTADKVRVVTTWGELAGAIYSYSRIGTLVIVSHAASAELMIGLKARTLSMFAAGVKPEDNEDPFPGLAAYPGSIGTLVFDGCAVGRDPSAVLDFARRVPVSKVEAWTKFRWIDLYSTYLTGDRDDALARIRASGELERVSPHLPKGSDGGTYSAAELEAELARNGQVAFWMEVYGEYHDLEFGKTAVELAAMPSLPFVPGTHFTRADGLRNTLDVHTQADAQSAMTEINRSRPVLHKLVVHH